MSTQAAIFAPASSFLPSALLFLLDVERLCIEKKRGVLWRRRIHQGDKCALNLLFRFLLLSTRQHSSTPYTYKFLLGKGGRMKASSDLLFIGCSAKSLFIKTSFYKPVTTCRNVPLSPLLLIRSVQKDRNPSSSSLLFSISHSGRALNGQRGKSTGISSVTQHWDSVPSLSLSLATTNRRGEMVDLRARGLDGNEGTRHRRRSAYTDVSILHLQRLN